MLSPFIFNNVISFWPYLTQGQPMLSPLHNIFGVSLHTQYRFISLVEL